MDFERDTLVFNLSQCHIPQYMHGGIVRWIQQGIRPGKFLVAVLENDLRRAVTEADDNNIKLLVSYVHFFYNHAPGGCSGSVDRVKEWEQMGGLKKRINITIQMLEDCLYEHDGGE